MGDIVERLRDPTRRLNAAEAQDKDEAATTISNLQAENARLRGVMRHFANTFGEPIKSEALAALNPPQEQKGEE